MYYLLRDFEHKQTFPHIKALIEHAAAQSGRSEVELARVVILHEIAWELETLSPRAWRSRSEFMRWRLAGAILHRGRLVASWHTRNKPFHEGAVDHRHRNPGRPRNKVPP